MDIKIDPEFAALGTALTAEERNLLEANIDSLGCLDSLKVWQGQNILLDGHNRYGICKDLDKPYKVEALQFANREAAIEWVIDYQLGRRNANEEVKAYYRGKRYQHEKKKQGGDGSNQHKSKRETVSSLRTAEKLGEEYGVSDRTIKNDAAFADAIDAIDEVAPEVKATILSGKSKATRKEVQQVAALPKEERKEAAQALIEKPARVERDTEAPLRTGVATDVEKLIEGIEKLITKTDAMAAQRMGHNAKSQALVDHLRESIKLAKAMGRSWRNF